MYIVFTKHRNYIGYVFEKHNYCWKPSKILKHDTISKFIFEMVTLKKEK